MMARVERSTPGFATSFVGRADALARLDALAVDAKRIVIAGPPGVGKSRLVARWVGPRDARVARADLSTARDLEDGLRRIARALALDFGPQDDTERVVHRVGQVLASRTPVILWLDDADAVVEALAAPLARWDAEGLLTLVTSRRAVLDVPCSVLTLPPLSREEALELLVERARTVRPDFVASEAQRPSLEALIDHLDAMPLALELVAPRLRLLSPAQLLARLAALPGARDALGVALERSFELLQPWERDALGQCAVFRDGFYLEAAEAVIDLSAHRGAPDVLTVLESLVAQSLLRTEAAAELPDEVRVRHFGAVREHAAKMLASDTGEVRRRHARYYRDAAERWDEGIESPDEAACTARLVIELPNLEVAYEASEDDPETAARLALVLHMAYQRRGPFGRQRELVEEARALAARSGERGLLARAELAVARVLRWSGELAESDGALERALASAVEAGDVATEASCARNLAANRFRDGDLDAFGRHLQHALEAAQRSGRASDEVNARNGLGYLYAERGDTEVAQTELERALRLAQQTEIPGLIALVHASLSELTLRAERLKETERHASAAIAVYERLGYLRQWAREHLVRGWARMLEGDLEGAEADADAALERARWLGLAGPAAEARELGGLVAFLRGDFVAAREALEERAAAIPAGHPRHERTWAYVGAARARLGHETAAEEAFARVGDGDAVTRALLAFARGTSIPLDSSAGAEARRIAAMAEGATAGVRLNVAGDGRSFSVGEDEPVDLTRRRALRGILEALVAQHVVAPGEPISLDGVLDAGWPGERMSPESGARRVYVTINRLRKLGLGDLLLTTGDGYMIAPGTDVKRAPSDT